MEAVAASAVAIVAIVALIFNVLLVRRTTDYVRVTREMVQATQDAANATREAATAAQHEAEASTRAALAAEQQLMLMRLQHENSREIQEREAAPSLQIVGSTIPGAGVPNSPPATYKVRNGGPGTALHVRLLANSRYGEAHPIRSGEAVDVSTSMAPPMVITWSVSAPEIYCQDVLGIHHRFGNDLHETWRTGEGAPVWGAMTR